MGSARRLCRVRFRAGSLEAQAAADLLIVPLFFSFSISAIGIWSSLLSSFSFFSFFRCIHLHHINSLPNPNCNPLSPPRFPLPQSPSQLNFLSFPIVHQPTNQSTDQPSVLSCVSSSSSFFFTFRFHLFSFLFFSFSSLFILHPSFISPAIHLFSLPPPLFNSSSSRGEEGRRGRAKPACIIAHATLLQNVSNSSERAQQKTCSPRVSLLSVCN